ncbi:MAG TPA: hypothetical protein VFS40_08325 [Gemmatimonadales bacterium]|nr:hypothetical protein [Gemmatimonadales bacterium]
MRLARGMSEDALRAWRDARLARLVAHAYERVPFYRRLLDAHGVRPRHVRGVADLGRLPIVTKADLLAAGVDVYARGVDPARLDRGETSGSSGEPFTIRRTRAESARLDALRRRAYRSVGLRARDRVARLAHSARPGGPGARPLASRLLRRAGLRRVTTLDMFAPPAQIAGWLDELRPDVLGGYPGVVARVAEACAAQGLDAVRPRLVITGAEVLTGALRRAIADAFGGARVVDTYGTMECNLLAWECLETGALHTCDDGAIVEVVRADGRAAEPGERGEVVATNLHAFAMPFLRYRVGDLATRGATPCACGAPFGTLAEVRGRMIDHFLLPGGRILHPYQLTDRVVWDGLPWVRRYQTVQERTDRIVMRVVPAAAPPAAELARVREAVAAVLGAGVEFHLELVPEIPLEPSGKFRPSRSLVASVYDEVRWADLDPAPAAAGLTP